MTEYYLFGQFRDNKPVLIAISGQYGTLVKFMPAKNEDFTYYISEG